MERDKAWDRERDRHRDRRDVESERHLGKDHRRDREPDYRSERRDRERSRDRIPSGDGQRDRERQRQKEKERRARAKSMERGLEEELGHNRDWERVGRASWEEEEEGERRAGGRLRAYSNPDEVFDDLRGDTRELWDPHLGEDPGRERSHTHSSGDTGTTLSPSLGSAGVWCAGWLLLL